MKIKINANYGVNDSRTFEEEVPDDWDEERIEEYAKGIVFEQIDWFWEKVAENEKG